jgi:hypothetical protein
LICRPGPQPPTTTTRWDNGKWQPPRRQANPAGPVGPWPPRRCFWVGASCDLLLYTGRLTFSSLYCLTSTKAQAMPIAV